MPQFPKIHFYPACGLNSYEGYGRAEIGFLQGARATGLELGFYPDEDVISLQFGNPKWGASPFMAQAKRRWLWSMLESTRLSDEWVENINRHYERVIVPAPDMPQLFKDSGVILPIHVIPLGVDAFLPDYCERQHSKPFTFLAYSYGDIRKAAELSVMAFKMLYEGNGGYRLVVKCRDNHDVQWLRAIQNEQISVIGGVISEAEQQKLWNAAHCFLFPSRAEGFGLPPREAALAGIPTISSSWLGLWDVHKWGYPLSIRDMRPCQYMREVNNKVGALWAEPSFEDLLHWMAYIPQNYAQAIADNKEHRAYLLNHFTWDIAARKFIGLLETYA